MKMYNWIDVPKAVSSIAGTRIHVLPVGRKKEVRTILQDLGFRLCEIEGSKVIDEASFVDQMVTCLNLEPGGRNWDALIDVLSELEHRPERRYAIFWDYVERLVRSDLQTFVTAVTILDSEAAGFSRIRDDGSIPIQMHVFLIGGSDGSESTGVSNQQ